MPHLVLSSTWQLQSAGVVGGTRYHHVLVWNGLPLLENALE